MAEVSEKFMEKETKAEEFNEVELMDYLRVLWKWRVLIVAGTILCMIIAAVVSLMMPKVYRSTALLLIADPKLDKNEVLKLPSIDTYIGIIKSQTVAMKVLEKLGLDQSPYHLTPEDLINNMISVISVRGTNLIQVAVEYTDPEKARDVANTVATSAIELNRSLNEEESIRLKDFLKVQLDEVSLALAKTEQELLAFKEAAEIDKLKKEIQILLEEKQQIEQGEGGRGLLGIDRLIEEKNTVVNTLAKKLENEQKILVLSRSISNDSVMQDVIKEASNLPTFALLGIQIKNEQVNPLYEELEPKLVEALSDLEGLKVKKAALIRDLEANEKRLTDLQKELAQKEVKIENLTRSYELAKEVYKSLKQRFEEARILVASKTQELKVVDPAITPKNPIRPSKKLNTLISGVVGFMSLVLLAFLLEYISHYKIETSIKSRIE